ncbi:MAG: ParB/RepB/Spo0J family partition protein [Firmicutes bacterium]|nr:ParB/RepB/Spo0J family partition protein [Bacillota bacterium]
MKKGLGKGLGALLGENDDFLEKFEEREAIKQGVSIPLSQQEAVTNELAIEAIMRNEKQPRKIFDEAALDELVNSIRVHGVITPIIVVPKDDRYMIIAGERRWRASRRAGIRTIPAIIRKYTPQQVAEISLIENLQREDLNPIETANAIKQLMDEHNYTHEEVAHRIGKSRSAVTNMLGLLTLPQKVVDLVAQKRISPAHAKILTSIENKEAQIDLAMKALDGKMSVRKFEELVRAFKNPDNANSKDKFVFNIEFQELIQNMQRVFATKVSAFGNNTKGRIFIDYYSRDDLDRFVELIDVLKHKDM